jgi:hypothetical protein
MAVSLVAAVVFVVVSAGRLHPANMQAVADISISALLFMASSSLL